ncbi:MAG: glycosyltransferase family 2 protein, partial [Pseudonocardiaceae bacterium]
VVDDGSRDGTAEIARAAGAGVISHETSRGLGAALRSGLSHARERDYAAVAYIDGDDEYDSAELATLLEPIARGRADYVLGSRFLGRREGMSWHRTLANRATTAILGALMGTVMSDAQTGYRAFSRRALAAAEIRHDYNFAQVLTLSLWGAGIEPVEVEISYRRRAGGRSFVRYPEYLVRVAPVVWRQWRDSRTARTSRPHPSAAASTYGPAELPKNGKAPVSGPNGASGRGVTSPPEPSRTST